MAFSASSACGGRSTPRTRCGEHQDAHPVGGHGDGQLLQPLRAPAEARAEGGGKPLGEALDHLLVGGQAVDLPQSDVDGGVADQTVVAAQVAGEVLDLELRLAEGLLQEDDVLQPRRLLQELLQALQLGPLGGEAGLAVVVRLPHVLCVLTAVGDMAHGPGLVQEQPELLRRHPDRAAEAPVTALLVEGPALIAAPHARHRLVQGHAGSVEALSLQLQVLLVPFFGSLPG